MSSTIHSVPGPKETASQGLRQFSSFLSGFPSWFYSREVQMVIDILISSLAVLMAYRLRFDAGIPIRYKLSMWILMLGLPGVRMLSILLTRGYEMVCRY